MTTFPNFASAIILDHNGNIAVETDDSGVVSLPCIPALDPVAATTDLVRDLLPLAHPSLSCTGIYFGNGVTVFAFSFVASSSTVLTSGSARWVPVSRAVSSSDPLTRAAISDAIHYALPPVFRHISDLERPRSVVR